MSKLILAAAVLVSALAAPLARADVPPPPSDNAPELKLQEGESKSISAPNGAQVVCDDPAVARPDIVDEKFVIIGVGRGTTLCGVRFAGLNKGLYKIVVVAAEKPEKHEAPEGQPKTNRAE